ncbi:sensor histidine kinase [Endozoicomonas sp. SM1973]|uniref:histidine kinase n=1 Tax=Spartinivicinus marinus TaxID=2994442 RepID=A0A853I7W5_9GAMM|nr:sensor histidine kinase [Spartinivicinus marinus]MCX4030159.1 sensor histidine kinase [Spartinivicinus marinus]NYZ67802.1 sensor histidine kinase [Spartinivicinus marinus]
MKTSLPNLIASRFSIKLKIWLIILLPLSIYCIISTYSTYQHTESISKIAIHNLRLVVENTLNKVAIQSLRRGNNDDILGVMESLVSHTDINMVVIYDSENEIFANYGKKSDTSDIFSKRLFFKAKRFNLSDLTSDVNASTGDNKYIGKLTYSIEKKSFNALSIRVLLGDLMINIGIFVLLCIPLILFLYRSLIKRLSLLKNHISYFKQGKYEWLNEEIVGTDEYSQVITALKDAATTIRKQTAELENQVKVVTASNESADRASNQKDTLIASIGYGLEIPLSGIDTWNDIISQHLNDAEDLIFEKLDSAIGDHKDSLLKLYRIIKQANYSLSKSIDNSSEINKILDGLLQTIDGTNYIDINPATFCLDTNINNYLYEFKNDIDTNQLKFDFNIINGFDKPIFVKSDWIRIRQVLNNLLMNAVNFTKSGEILIKSYFEPHNINHAFVRIQVTDTGCGIGEKEKIFSIIDGSKKYSDFSHAGYGLTIASNIATKLNGKIDLEYSEVNKGSRFSFTAILPLSNNNEIDEEINKSNKFSNKCNILYADHSLINKILFQNICLYFDIHIIYEEEYNEELVSLSSLNIDAIVISDTLINSDSSEKIESIRKKFIGNNCKTPLFVAAYDQRNLKTIGKYLNTFDELIAKPYSRDTINNIMNRLKTK